MRLMHVLCAVILHVEFLSHNHFSLSDQTRCRLYSSLSPHLKLIDLSFICAFAWLFPILIVLCCVMRHININVCTERPNPGLKWRYSIFRGLLIVKAVIIKYERWSWSFDRESMPFLLPCNMLEGTARCRNCFIGQSLRGSCLLSWARPAARWDPCRRLSHSHSPWNHRSRQSEMRRIAVYPLCLKVSVPA